MSDMNGIVMIHGYRDKIAAILAVRRMEGLSLAEAKRAVESIDTDHPRVILNVQDGLFDQVEAKVGVDKVDLDWSSKEFQEDLGSQRSRFMVAGTLVYSLRQNGWRSGKPSMINDHEISVQGPSAGALARKIARLLNANRDSQ